MKFQLDQLARRREHLQALTARQRLELGQHVEPLRAPLALVDRGMEAVRYVRRNPLLVAGASTLFFALRKKGSGKWLRRGWLAWQLIRRMRMK